MGETNVHLRSNIGSVHRFRYMPLSDPSSLDHHRAKWDLPELQGIFGAVVGVMLHVVEETEEIL